MEDLAVMYHYVQRSNWKGIVPLEPEDFSTQLDWLLQHYEIVSPDDLGKSKKRKPRCVLTFDDGTKDQYEVAYKILCKKGLPAYFTVMSGPLLHRQIPVFHLVHSILSFYSDKEVWENLCQLFDMSSVPALSGVYSYEKDLYRRYNKYAFNFFLTEEQSKEILEKKLLEVYQSFDKFIEEFYISAEEFIKMRKAGMELGVHAVHHRPFDGDGSSFYREGIEPCREYMKNVLGVIPRWYTPAFGGGEKFAQMMQQLEPVLQENGFVGGFTTQSGLNDGMKQFWLSRYDCNKLPPKGQLLNKI